MMIHPNFYTDITNSEPVYRCCECQFDTFEMFKIKWHAATHHRPVTLWPDGQTIEEWAENERKSHPLDGITIGIGFLTWNTLAASVIGANALVAEVRRLDSLGVNSYIYWVDNGSGDGSQTVLTDIFDQLRPRQWESGMFSTNRGQAIGRNCFLRHLGHCDYILFVDGDVEIIPYSSYAMAKFLHRRPLWFNREIGCLGMNASNWTNMDGPEVSYECREIGDDIVNDELLTAWTQYGMFRGEMFHKGLKFDEKGPFAGPGWGFEDDDLGLYMASMGYANLNTKYFRYLHRSRNSSWASLGEPLVTKVAKERRDYVVGKWSGYPNPLITDHLRRLSAQTPERWHSKV